MRRIVAIVLPELACELALREELTDGQRPFAVIVDDEPDEALREVVPRAVLHAVDPIAWRYGARPGQRAAEAAALVGRLHVVHLGRDRLCEALGRVAELALAFGPSASLDAPGDTQALSAAERKDDGRRRDEAATMRYPAGAGAGPYDTVWLDVTGCTRLVGGEDLLLDELHEQLSPLGHRLRFAIADGPRIAQAMARWASHGPGGYIAPRGRSVEHLAPLPVAALPLRREQLAWLGKLGILQIEDLHRIDRAQLTPRLTRKRGARHKTTPAEVKALLELVAGRDDTPLEPYVPHRCIVERAAFDTELCGTEPLLFVLRGLNARAVSRLQARGEACSRAVLTLYFDAGYLCPRLTAERDVIDGELDADDQLVHRAASQLPLRPNPELELSLELPVPLADEGELMQAWTSKLERLELPAPVRSLALTLDDLAPQRHHQLDLHRQRQRDPHALPTLLAELSAWLGPDRIGTLEVVPVHRPELRSRLTPYAPGHEHAPLLPPAPSPLESEPTRLLPQPLPLGAPLTPEAQWFAGRHVFTLRRLRLVQRLDAVEWWRPDPVHRDYSRATLRTPHETSSDHHARGLPASSHYADGFLFVTPDDPVPRLHGWFD